MDDEKLPLATSNWIGFLVTQPPRLILASRSRGKGAAEMQPQEGLQHSGAGAGGEQ